MIKKNIYIFTSKSYQPNLYINILGSCVDEFGLDSIEDINLLKIEEEGERHKNNELSPSQELKLIRENIITQLNALSKVSFHNWDRSKDKFQENSLVQEIQMKDEFLEIYKSLKRKVDEDEIKYRVIKQSSLENTLKRVINNPSYEFIFDLTGIPKKDFLKISLILLSKECSIYIFESLRRFTSDENDMIHNLLELNKYHKDKESYIHHHLNTDNYKVIRNSMKNQLESIKKSWKFDISKDRTKKVLNEVNDYLEKLADIDIDLQKEIVNLSRRNHEINNKHKANILSKADYDIEVNRINDALIDIIYKIE